MTDHPTYHLRVDLEVKGRAKSTAMRAIVQRIKEVTHCLDIAMTTGTFETDYNHDAIGKFEVWEVRK